MFFTNSVSVTGLEKVERRSFGGQHLKMLRAPPGSSTKTDYALEGVYSLSLGHLGCHPFFTREVWTRSGLVTYHILFFIQLKSRKVHIAGITPNPDGPWMTQMGRNPTMVEWDFLTPGQHLLHIRDTKFCPTLQETMKADGATPKISRTQFESECPCRALGEVREGGSPVTAHPVWGRRPPAGAQRVWHPLSSGTPSSGKEQ